MRRLVCAVCIAWLAASACSLHQTSSTAATGARTTAVGTPLAAASGGLDAEVALPAGFPSDFPTYPHARLTAAAPFASAGQAAWGMEWETLDSLAKVEAFYTKQLDQGDWAITNAPSPGAEFSAAFTRKSDKNVQGALAADVNGSVTKILLSLVYPA